MEFLTEGRERVEMRLNEEQTMFKNYEEKVSKKIESQGSELEKLKDVLRLKEASLKEKETELENIDKKMIESLALLDEFKKEYEEIRLEQGERETIL